MRAALTRGLVVLAVFLAAVMVAGCAGSPGGGAGSPGGGAGSPGGGAGSPGGGSTAGGNASAFDARARQVAAAWQHSPAAKVWRTGLVLLSAGDLTSIPRGKGFPAGEQKVAFTDGAYVLDGRLPAGRPPGRVSWADGGSATVPVLTARQAFEKIAVHKPCTAGPCGKLTVTGARPSTLTVATSRGQATIPAWSFTVRELPFPVIRAALAPGSYATVPTTVPTTVPAAIPSRPGQGFGGVSAAKVAADGRTLTLRFGTGVCATRWGGLVHPVGSVVVLGSWSYTPDTGSPCPAMMVLRTATVTLARPLGSRVLLDAGTGHPVVPGRG